MQVSSVLSRGCFLFGTGQRQHVFKGLRLDWTKEGNLIGLGCGLCISLRGVGCKVEMSVEHVKWWICDWLSSQNANVKIWLAERSERSASDWLRGVRGCLQACQMSRLPKFHCLRRGFQRRHKRAEPTLRDVSNLNLYSAAYDLKRRSLSMFLNLSFHKLSIAINILLPEGLPQYPLMANLLSFTSRQEGVCISSVGSARNSWLTKYKTDKDFPSNDTIMFW